MIQDSLENSPIITKRSTEVDFHQQQNGSKDASLDVQQIFATDSLFIKLTECAQKSDDESSPVMQKRKSSSDLQSRKIMDSYDQRNQLQPNDPLDKSQGDDNKEDMTNELEEMNNNSNRINSTD